MLQAALATFARFGYRKTSMEQVAQDAHISRPGLYFMFATKQDLFREAVELLVGQDLAAAEFALAGDADPFRQRLARAFDQWAGRYIGPLTHEVAALVDDHPDMVGPVVRAAPQRFAQLITDAVATQVDRETAERVAQTLIAASIGIKHQVANRSTYLERLDVAIDLLLPPGAVRASELTH